MGQATSNGEGLSQADFDLYHAEEERAKSWLGCVAVLGVTTAEILARDSVGTAPRVGRLAVIAGAGLYSFFHAYQGIRFNFRYMDSQLDSTETE